MHEFRFSPFSRFSNIGIEMLYFSSLSLYFLSLLFSYSLFHFEKKLFWKCSALAKKLTPNILLAITYFYLQAVNIKSIHTYFRQQQKHTSVRSNNGAYIYKWKKKKEQERKKKRLRTRENEKDASNGREKKKKKKKYIIARLKNVWKIGWAEKQIQHELQSKWYRFRHFPAISILATTATVDVGIADADDFHSRKCETKWML